jgi:hypothetical protein
MFLAVFTIPSWGMQSENDDSAICEEASEFAASRVGVPVDILRALTRTETGRNSGGSFQPWPWTVNMEGEGAWFATMSEALDFATKNFDRGARSFDIGCFQINYKWHGDAFASIEDMFDPRHNALYAAQFMLELYSELGSWSEAAGAYHSRTPEFASGYSDRFSRIFQNLDTQSSSPRETLLAANNALLEYPENVIVQPEFAPLIPNPNSTGSLFENSIFIAKEFSTGGILTLSRGSLLIAN